MKLPPIYPTAAILPFFPPQDSKLKLILEVLLKKFHPGVNLTTFRITRSDLEITNDRRFFIMSQVEKWGSPDFCQNELKM
jgi:hypothetical protein